MIYTIRYEKPIEHIQHDECVYKIHSGYIWLYYKHDEWILPLPDEEQNPSYMANHRLQKSNGHYCGAKVIRLRDGVNIFFYPDVNFSMEYQICTLVN